MKPLSGATTATLTPAQLAQFDLIAKAIFAAIGPDLDRLRAIRAAAPDRAIYAAGGVRGAADLKALRRDGIAGALVATSLHDGRLTSSDIAEA